MNKFAVLIVSKTHMSNAACVGGILPNGSPVRLLNSQGYNQDQDTILEIGDIYEVSGYRRNNGVPPHVEDLLVQSMTKKGHNRDLIVLRDFLLEKMKVKVWRGHPDNLFDGKIQWTNNGSGYISEEGGIPSNSVGFWISDKPLSKRVFYEKVRYNYPSSNEWRNMTFVGFQEPVETIPAGTLLRVSLARWWDRNGETEPRCSLQLSGWYTNIQPPRNKVIDGFDDDLPW